MAAARRALPTMLDLNTFATCAAALLIPVLYLKFRNSSRPALPQRTEEPSTEPLKPIMQGPRDDLDPPKDDPFTPEELAKYDGTDPSQKIYVAIKGTIFDVTRKAEVYGPGKSYHIFAGKDGSRGLGMSSLKAEHAVADYSTLNEADRKVLDEWYIFFSKRYNIVGRVVPPKSATPPDN